jgi:hypothetical protein
LVYNCDCDEHNRCYQADPAWCSSDATFTNQYVMGAPCDDEP